jgi:transposase
MAGKKGMKHYSREVKLEAVRLYNVEGKSQAEIIEALGINNVRRVKQWLHAYRQAGENAFEPRAQKGVVGRRPKRENTEAYIARLEMENDLLKNSMPNCASWSSPSAISAHLPPKRNIRSKGDVHFLRNIASSLLCLGEAFGPTGSRCRTNGTDPGSIREISPNLWIPQDRLVAPEAKGNLHEPQSRLAADEQIKYSLGSSPAKDLPKIRKGKDPSSLCQSSQPGFCGEPSEPEMGYGCDLHCYPTGLGLSLHDPGSVRWIHRRSPIRARKLSGTGPQYPQTSQTKRTSYR